MPSSVNLDLSWLSWDGVAGLAVVSWVSGAWLVSGAVSPALRSLVAGAGGSVSGERDEALVAGGDEICPGPSLGETQDASTPGGDQARGHGQQPRRTRARTATIRRTLVTVPARIASSARRLTLHLPRGWPWETAWNTLFNNLFRPHHDPRLT